MARKSGRVSMRQIAEDAGVSIGAVSATINGTKSSIGVSKETKARIQESIRKLGYTVNAQARSLRLGRTNQIGVVLDDITLPFLAQLTRLTGRALLRYDYSMLLYDVSVETEHAETALKVCAQNRADAMLLAVRPSQITDQEVLELENRVGPIVLVERKPPDDHIRCVRVDNAYGGRIAVQHLLEQGATKIAILTNPSNPISDERLDGARQALQKNNLSEVALLSGDWSLESGYAAMAEWLQTQSPDQYPDGLFALNDTMAIGAMRALRDANLHPGEDIAVIGYDDIALAQYTEPALSTIRQPVEEMAADAAMLLLDAVGHANVTCSSRHLVCRPSLVTRASSKLNH